MKEELENEREWRRFLMIEVQEIKKAQVEMLTTMTSLKIKIGAISTLFGAVGGVLLTWVTKHLG